MSISIIIQIGLTIQGHMIGLLGIRIIRQPHGVVLPLRQIGAIQQLHEPTEQQLDKMNNKTTIDNNKALFDELKTVHWEKYVEFAEITCEVKGSELKMVYVEQSIKET